MERPRLIDLPRGAGKSQLFVMTTNRSTKAAAFLFALMASAGLLFAGCQHRATETNGGLSGQFTLASVDGRPVPAKVKHDRAELEVRSGWFRFETNGTCSTLTVFVPPSGQEVRREVSAEYKVDGPNVTMKWKGAGMTAGTIDRDTFTMNNEGMIFVYKK